MDFYCGALTEEKAGTFYFIYPDDGRDYSEQSNITCHQISADTAIDLAPYLNKPVYVTGEYHYGNILLSSERVLDGLADEHWFRDQRPVLRIDGLELVENN